MNIKRIIIFSTVGSIVVAFFLLLPSAVRAEDTQKVQAAMTVLKSKAEKLGPAKIEGTDTVDGKTVPAIFFGAAKMNNNFALVDDVVSEVGGTATIFVKRDRLRPRCNQCEEG